MGKVKLGEVDVELGGDLVDKQGAKLLSYDDGKLGLFGATPVVKPSAYTQTYDAPDKTHIADGSSDAVAADAGTVTSADAATQGASYVQADVQSIATLANEVKADYNAAVTLINEVKADYNLLRAQVLDLKQLVNSVIDDLQALGIVG